LLTVFLPFFFLDTPGALGGCAATTYEEGPRSVGLDALDEDDCGGDFLFLPEAVGLLDIPDIVAELMASNGGPSTRFARSFDSFGYAACLCSESKDCRSLIVRFQANFGKLRP
jgi:hypothetical protein